LASMLSLGRLFANDYQDGTLEQLLLTPQPLFLVVLGKTLAHWIVAEVPLVLIAPLVGVQFDLSRETLWILFVSLLVGTPVLSLIGSVGAALTLGLRGGGVLISLLVLPLYIPALIFGAGAAADASRARTLASPPEPSRRGDRAAARACSSGARPRACWSRARRRRATSSTCRIPARRRPRGGTPARTSGTPGPA